MITAVILTKNESDSIQACLDSLSFCQNILVVDDGSTDQTLEIAKKYPVQIVHHSLNGDFSAQRNWALTKVGTPWVLFIDADETVSPDLAAEITSTLDNPKFAGYYILRAEYLWDKRLKYGDVQNKKLLRLAKKDVGAWQGNVHETWQIKGPTSTFKNPLIHKPHPNLKSFLQHINYYSDLRSQELAKQHVKPDVFQIIFYPIAKFIYCYILRLGFLDSTAGFVHALVMAFYSFLVRSKLWMKSHA